jgi:hypothetical protein
LNLNLQERKQVLDDGWLLMLLAAALAVAVPWFVRNSQLDLAPVTWSVFLYGVAYLALSRGMERSYDPRAKLFALTALQFAAIVFAAFLWHLAGNVQNPMFLMVFALPVAAAGCVLPGARPILLAVAAIVCVGFVALLDAPQLRWYMTQLGVPMDAIPGRFYAQGTKPFPGLDMPAAYVFLLFVTFSVVIMAVALLSQSVATLLRNLSSRLDSSARALNQANTLAVEVLHASPHPVALVYSDTFNVAHASRSFLQRMELLPESLQEKDFFALADFAYPEVIQELIAGKGGEVPVALYRAGGSTHLARVHVHPVEHGGARYACVTIEDIAHQLLPQVAVDALPEALLVIGADGQVRHFNAAAAHLLEDLAPGVEAAIAFEGVEAPEGWWVLGPRTQRELPVAVGGKPYEARCTAVAVPGMQDRLTVVRLRAAGA